MLSFIGILGVMKAKTLKQLLLYNYRYLFAYGCIAAFSIFFLLWRLWALPPGLAEVEISTAARHTTIADILHMPLYPLHAVLQWLSMELLGTGPLALRLPSVLLAAATVFLTYHVLKRWFGKPAALLSAALLASADWYLYIARLGVGSIEFTFWLALAFLSLTKVVSRRGVWLIPLCLSLTLLLFAPFGIFAVATLVTCLLTIEVFRVRIKETGLAIKLTGALIVVTGLLLAIAVSVQNSTFMQHLIGSIGGLPSPLSYAANVLINTSGAVALLPGNNPMIGPSDLFYIRYFEFIFIIFGIIMLWRTRVNRLNVTVLILSLVLALSSGLSDGSRGGSLLLLPAIIYITAGIRHLMHRWQKTFPKNPYARITAYAPMALLVGLVTFIHYYTYFRVWPNQTTTRTAFSQQYLLLQHEIARQDGSCIVVGAPEPLQKLARQTNQGCRPVFQETVPPVLGTDHRAIIASQGVKGSSAIANSVFTPLVDGLRESSLHWWVLESDASFMPTPDIIEVER